MAKETSSTRNHQARRVCSFNKFSNRL